MGSRERKRGWVTPMRGRPYAHADNSGLDLRVHLGRPPQTTAQPQAPLPQKPPCFRNGVGADLRRARAGMATMSRARRASRGPQGARGGPWATKSAEMGFEEGKSPTSPPNPLEGSR